MEKVSRRRKRVYEYIIMRLNSGTSPTVREVCEHLQIPSTSTVHGDLKHLREEGLIEMTEGLNRTIRLPGPGGIRVPLVGAVTAGEPILAMQNIEQYIPVPLVQKQNQELFALRVQGDSMEGAAILDGDLVVVERTSTAENGQIVVAMLGEEATVKRLYREGGKIRLQPENDAYTPIVTDQVEVLGKVLAVVRIFE